MTTLESVFTSLCTHIEFSTNGGSIRPAISVYRPRIPAAKDKFRIWNKQLLSYAGHVQEDGSVIGDKGGVVFTNVSSVQRWSKPYWRVLIRQICDFPYL